jgi:hypothetical protein
MSILFSSLVESYLIRASLEPNERAVIAEQMAFSQAEMWQAIENISPPPLLLPSHDPVVLALRRLVARDPRPLGARHRVALQQASTRPYGLLRLALEEAWLVGQRADSSQVDALVASLEAAVALAEQVPADYPRELADLRAYGLLAIAHIHALAGQAAWEAVWYRAIDATKEGTDDPDLQSTALEVAAQAAVLTGLRNSLTLANGWWRLALALHIDAIGIEPDRLAEIHAGYANFLAAQGHKHNARKHLRAAERRLAEVEASWNEPLRVRLAALSASNLWK